MSTVPQDHGIEMLQQNNAKLLKQLDQMKQLKQEKAKRKAQAKLAELQEQLKVVNALHAAKETRAALQKQQLDEIHKLEAHLRLSALEMFTGTVQWEAGEALWGPEKWVCLRTQEPGNKDAVPKELFPKALRLSMQPFAIGGMRLAYYALTNEGQRFVAKRLLLESAHRQKNVEVFVEDVHTHREAARLATIFKERCKSAAVDATLQFGPVYIVEVPCMDHVDCVAPTVLLLEEYLEGKFTKWNTNTGQVRGSTDDIPQAFSHFTHHVTRKEARGQPKLVVDIQGVVNPAGTVYQLTDPAILCERGPHSYGATNCGARGIRLFFESHRCNHVCRKLGLPDNKLYRPPDAGASGHVAVALWQWAPKITLSIIFSFVFLWIVVLSVSWMR